MTKLEFIEVLRTALNGRISPGQVTENMRYYEDYINMEIRKGRSEEEVLAALGDPRLIARTIAETKGGRNGGSGYADAGGWSKGSGYADERGGRNGVWGEREYRMRSQPGRGLPKIFFKIPPWVWLAFAILAIVIILGAVFSAAVALLPVLLPVFGILFILKIFRSWKR